MDHDQRRHELSDFLRSRRERLSPEAAGLPVGSRRRTPGLRREEVAQLAHVSTTWYTFMEQGRPVQASAQVLEGIATALRLTSPERRHLFLLALQQEPPDHSPAHERVSPALQRLLDSLETSPAHILNGRWDILAWNRAACILFDFDVLDERERNFVRYFFTNERHRRLLVDWEGQARLLLAKFRVTYSRHLGDEALARLVAELNEVSPEFREWWPRHEVDRCIEARKLYDHPEAGRLVFEFTSFQVEGVPELRLSIQTPLAESDTPAKFEKLCRTFAGSTGTETPPKAESFAAGARSSGSSGPQRLREAASGELG